MEATKVALLYAAVIATIMCIEETLRLFFGNRRATVILIAIGILALMWAGTARADCGHFFRKQQHVAIVQQVVAPVYAYPQVYYSAGADLQAEALAEKVARLVQQKLTAAEPLRQPVKTTSAFAKCAACHTGPSAAGGLVLDGTPVSCHTYFRWGQIAGQGKNIPAKMQALVSGLTPEQKGTINEALLDLVASDDTVVVPKPPVPDGGLE